MKTVADTIVDVLQGFGEFDQWWYDLRPVDQKQIKKALNNAVNNFPGIKSGVVTNQKTEKP